MELRQLEYAVTLADEGQFTRAAAVCQVSQSGLSAAIRSLEEELSSPLFARTTRRVSLTDAGRAFLPFARQTLAQASAARDAVVRATQSLSGRVRVGAEQCLGLVDVPALLERFHRRYPLVEIQFTQAGSHDLVDQVHAGLLDVAFVATTEHLGAVSSVEIGRGPIVALVPQGHPLASRAGVRWRDLAGLEFIDFRESWGVRSLNDATCRAQGVRRRVGCTVDDVHTLLDLIHRGLGIALVPRHVADKPQAGGLVAVPLPSAFPSWVVSAITGMHAEPSASRLLEILDSDEPACSTSVVAVPRG
jgi:DNA-binding transcriptional LysR family regulator